MKRLIIAIILVAAAIFLSLFGYYDLRLNGKRLVNQYINTAQEYQDNSDEYEESLKECIKFWEKHKTRFEIYINHDELDEIQMKMKELEQALEKKRDASVDELCLDCANRLNHIIDAETPSIGEVF